MIDIHPTHHGAFTRRDFFTHLGIVVLGILIAIGLEQTVEFLHHRHERQALIEGFHRECADNLKVFDRDLDMIHHNIAWDRSSLAILRNAKPRGGYIAVTMSGARICCMRAPSRSVWSVAKSSGKIELLPENLAEVFDRVDHEGQQFDDVIQAGVAATRRLSTFSERIGSPLNTDQTIRLTLAQRDEASILIDSLFVQDDQYRTWLDTWQGASQSVLDGVQTRDAMDSYIGRANQRSKPQ